MLPLPYVAAAALGIGLLTGWTANGWRLNAKIDNMVTEHSLAVKEATDKAMNETVRLQQEKEDAIAKAQVQIQANAAAASAARNERDRLRDDLAASRVAMSDASHASITAYAKALSTVFEQCTREYLAVAEKADGHAADTVILFDAWIGMTKK